MRLVNIKNRLWAVGLYWSKLHVRKVSRADLVKEVQRDGVDLFDVVAFRGQQQHGFGSTAQLGHPWQKALSLAAVLPLPSIFQGTFALEDVDGKPFWWVISQCDGVLASGMSDLALSTQKEAEDTALTVSAVEPDYARGESIVCLTPEESLAWLEPLLELDVPTRLLQRGKLREVQASRKLHPLLIGAGVALLLGVGVWGFNAWMDYRALENARETARLTKMNREQRKLELLARPEDQFDQPWLKAPLADAVATACLPAMHAVPLAYNGWTLGNAACTGRMINVAWSHATGADYLSLPDRATLKDPKNAVSRVALPVATQGQRQDQKYPALAPVELVTRQLYQLCQATGTRLRLHFRAPEKRTIDKVDVVAPWRAGDWELLETPSMLMGLMGDVTLFRQLASIPGLTVELIQCADGKWSIKGKVYASTK